MTRAPFVLGSILVLVLVLVMPVSACPDPCVLTLSACNRSADCEGDNVCDIAADDEVGCPVVGGLCIEGECGSDDDCDDGACCNRADHVCTFLAESCAAPECVEDEDCKRDESCHSGTCRDRCQADFDCPGTERCGPSGVCTDELGTPCIVDDNPSACGGGDCVDVDFDGNLVGPYCTDFCSSVPSGDRKETCGNGLTCNHDELECRLP